MSDTVCRARVTHGLRSPMASNVHLLYALFCLADEHQLQDARSAAEEAKQEAVATVDLEADAAMKELFEDVSGGFCSSQ